MILWVVGPLEKGQVRNEALRELRVELSKKHSAGELDSFTLYLYVSRAKVDICPEQRNKVVFFFSFLCV